MKSFNSVNTLRNIFKFQINKSLTKAATSMASQEKHQSTFETLHFDNLALRSLPIDSIGENYVREVKNACFSKVKNKTLKIYFILLKSMHSNFQLDITNAH